MSATNPQPLYQQVVDQLRALILAGDLTPGEVLPSVRQLAADIGASVITTRRAYLELERECLIVTCPGRGTFVAAMDPGRRRQAALRLLRRDLEALLARARAMAVPGEELSVLMQAVIEGKVLE